MPPNDLRSELEELKRRFADLEHESRANAGLLAGGLRRTRQQVLANELQQSVRRLRPPVSLLNWKPRVGALSEPAVSDSLIDRLRRGDAVADSIGNAEPVIGTTNQLLNPELVRLAGTPSTAGVAEAAGPGWTGRFELNSGTTISSLEIDTISPRGGINNPLNTSLVEFGAPINVGNAARDIDLFMYQTTQMSVAYEALPYLVASLRLLTFGTAIPAHWTTFDLSLEIISVTTGLVVASSEPLDMHQFDNLFAYRQLVVAYQSTPTAFRGSGWIYRIRLHMVSDGSAGQAALVYFGEPQMHFAYSPDAIPYAPQIALWTPERLATYNDGGTYEALEIIGGEIRFGSGSGTFDVKVYRAEANVLAVDDAVRVIRASTADTGFAVRLNTNTNDLIRLQASGAIAFGDGSSTPDTTLYRSAADVLKTDDQFEALRLRLTGTDDLSLSSTTHPFQIGPSSAQNLSIDPNEIEARNNGAASQLNLNTDGGLVAIGANAAPTTAADGLQFGTDVALYRSAANVLTTDDSFLVAARFGTYGETISTVDADQNNYLPTNLHSIGVLRFTSFTANRTLTGLDSGNHGDRLLIVNNTGFSLILAYASGSSSAANQFRLPGAANLTIRQQGAVELVYINSRWTALAV